MPGNLQAKDVESVHLRVRACVSGRCVSVCALFPRTLRHWEWARREEGLKTIAENIRAVRLLPP